MRSWETWTYGDWNERLISYVLGIREDGATGPVARIPATPEELRLVAKASESEAERVVERLCLAARAELAGERLRFLPYCLRYRSHKDWWSPNRSEIPYFFAMLWLTCLVAFGEFEVAEKSANENLFERRLARALGTNTASLADLSAGSFDDVWEDLARWTRVSRYRELILPPRCRFRTRIGRPHYLAFPHRWDRNELADVLAELGIETADPPVRPVLLALQKHRFRFSKGFQSDLENLFSMYLEKGVDPKESPFWRAVRHAAGIAVAALPSRQATSQSTGFAVLVELDDDDMFTPYLAGTSTVSSPFASAAEPLEFPVDGLTHRFDVGRDELSKVLSNPKVHLRGADALSFSDGLVPLLEVATDLFRVGRGEEIAHCRTALVKTEVDADFRAEFQPSCAPEPTGISGWQVYPDVVLVQRDRLSGKLTDAMSLMVTTDAPTPQVVGGVRIHDSRYLAILGYLPTVRTVGALRVVVERDGQEYECARDGDQASSWLLPQEVVQEPLGSRWTVRADYEVEILEHHITRSASTTFGLEALVLRTDYKVPSSGSFQCETCSRQVTSLPATGSAVSLGITTDRRDRALETLSLDPTVRWLGPGEGEMSLDRDCGFPWMVVGPWRKPDALVLVVDDPASAPRPNTRTSLLKRDRTHWRCALGQSSRVLWYRSGQWIELDDWGHEARQLYEEYRDRTKHPIRPAQRTGKVAATDLQARIRQERWGDLEQASGVRVVQEVVAQLSANRAGLPLREFLIHLRSGLRLPPGSAGLARHVARSFEESGSIDVLRRADGRQRVVFVRQPRFVAFRRAGMWKAVLVGWLPPDVRNELVDQAEAMSQCKVSWQMTTSPFAPPLLVVTCAHLGPLVELSTRGALPDVEFLDWPDVREAPQWARIRDDVRRDPIFEDYQADALWCWRFARFTTMPDDPGPIEVVRMTHGIRVPAYQLVENGRPIGWSYSRTWALLAAYEQAGRAFVHRTDDGALRLRGDSPMHLPVPLARLCAIAGMGLPGPELSTDGVGVAAYVYPFGEQLLTLLHPHLPAPWTAD